MAEGVQLVRQQLVDLLERRGLAEIEAEPGDAFDPHVHEALSHEPSEHPEGAIAAVWQRGYRLGDRVVRPARVVVSSGRRRARPRWRLSHYEMLGVPQGRVRRRDQEGVPQAGPPVPPRPQPRRRGGGGAVQGGRARRTTCSPIPRSASSTTPSARRSGRARRRGDGFQGASTSATRAGLRPGRPVRRAVQPRRRRPARASSARLRGRRCRGGGAGVVRRRAARRHAQGAGGQGQRLHGLPRLRRGARHVAHDLPGLQGPRRDRPRARASSRSATPAAAAAARAP